MLLSFSLRLQGISIYHYHAVTCPPVMYRKISISLMFSDTPNEGIIRNFDVKITTNLRKLLEEEFPSGLQLNELYAAYEVSLNRLSDSISYWWLTSWLNNFFSHYLITLPLNSNPITRMLRDSYPFGVFFFLSFFIFLLMQKIKILYLTLLRVELAVFNINHSVDSKSKETDILVESWR